MATGRIGVTPTLRTRWSKQPSAGTTSLSGLDDNSVSLVYDVGYEAVYRNGVLLSRGNDYTATSGTSITLIDATLTGDVIEVLANQLVPLNDAISKGQFTAKGALLSATAASTPGVITVGANDTVLTADSSTATGLKWATPAAGGMTLISTTSLTGASVTISSIPSTYNNLQLVIEKPLPATNGRQLQMRYNSDTASNYFASSLGSTFYDANVLTSAQFVTYAWLHESAISSSTSQSIFVVDILQYANTNTYKRSNCYWLNNDSTTTTSFYVGSYKQIWRQTSAINSITLQFDVGNFTSGTAYLYGVK